MNRRKFLSMSLAGGTVGLYAAGQGNFSVHCACDASMTNWYVPKYLEEAPNNYIVKVRDTDSALGRYNKSTKDISITDVIKFHGHMCDGVTFSYLQIYAALQKIFKDGVVDRTDLAGACKNSPCMVDSLAYMTGARINFKTLRIDATLGASHIIHRISTNETYQVKLFDSEFPTALKKLEKKIKTNLANKEPVSPADIDQAEKLADEFIYRLLHTDLEKLVEIKALKNYTFKPNSDVSAFGKRSDIVNKNVSRS